MCGRVSFDARRANFFFRPLFGFEFDFDPAPRARRYRMRDTVALRALPKMCLSCVVGRATSCRARARVSAVAAPCASAHRGSVGRSSSAPAPTHPRGGLEAGATMALRGRGSDIRAQHVFLAPSTRIPAP